MEAGGPASRPLSLYRRSLKSVLSSEAKVYGFTLVIWSTGALTTAEHGTPGRLDVIAFAVGALVAVGLIILVCFGGPAATLASTTLRRYTFGAVHIGSVAVAILAAWGIAAAIHRAAPAFLAASFSAALVYQLLLGAEVALSVRDDPRRRPDRA